MRSCVCILLSKSSLLLLLAVAPAATTVTGMLLDDVVALAGDIEDSCITGMGTPCWDTCRIYSVITIHMLQVVTFLALYQTNWVILLM